VRQFECLDLLAILWHIRCISNMRSSRVMRDIRDTKVIKAIRDIRVIMDFRVIRVIRDIGDRVLLTIRRQTIKLLESDFYSLTARLSESECQTLCQSATFSIYQAVRV
jgi:hypothetical protein